MGCAASVAQAPNEKPVPAGAGPPADAGKHATPAPVVEDVSSVQDPEPAAVAAPPAAAAELPPAPSGRPSNVQQPEQQPPPAAHGEPNGAVSASPAAPSQLAEEHVELTQQGSLPHTSSTAAAAAAEVARLVLSMPRPDDADPLPPPPPPPPQHPPPPQQQQQPLTLPPNASVTASLDAAVTPSCASTTVTLLGEGSAFVARSRYTNESDLSIPSTSYDLSGRGDDSDEDELEALFSLQAWKRYYGYNKKKHQDLLTYFWRKFQPADYSCFCISYRQQDLLLTAYMADNCVHGYCCRIEEMRLSDALFLQMYVLHDFECDLYRIVGLLLVQGQVLPQELAALSALDGFVYLKADTSVTLVKQFVSALLVGKSPLNSLQLLSSREML
ncbi:Elongation factor 1-gamma 2 [Tetrabaena socialis]|uniref:Elongation factor 1-gamma 2 n=1 Tax=Tetrabaena socialis TaxID=47790 RepID=A0A2J7ZYN4_9CHLO|nr:Elongation factor 1-gamma 2 [Tetrabaena socialis]|eukprot:PNH05381.1 Elongation factor 1-gamma 2 [Tetrabaena socialis]